MHLSPSDSDSDSDPDSYCILPMEVDYALWSACAGNYSQLPAAGDLVCYFPKIHALHAYTPSPDSPNSSSPLLRRFPPLMFPCQVVSTNLSAHSISDEVYAALTLCPITHCIPSSPPAPLQVKAAYFEKVLCRTDVGKGGRLYLPRTCADFIFPKIYRRRGPAAQNITFLDVHGKVWEFKYIYCKKSRSHYLTVGWSKFVQGKSLVHCDSVIFTSNLNGQLFIGVRRTANPNRNSPDECIPSLDEERSAGNEGCFTRKTRCRISQDAVMESMKLAFAGKPFEVLHYPKVGWPEFVVAKDSVKASSAEPRKIGTKRSLKVAVTDPIQPVKKKNKT